MGSDTNVIKIIYQTLSQQLLLRFHTYTPLLRFSCTLSDLKDFSFRYRTSSYISVISPVASGLAWVSPEQEWESLRPFPYFPSAGVRPVPYFCSAGVCPVPLFPSAGVTPDLMKYARYPFSVSGRNARSHEVRPVPYFRSAGVRPVTLFPSAGVRPVPYFWSASVRPISKSAWTRPHVSDTIPSIMMSSKV